MKEEEKMDYSKYAFRLDTKLEVDPMFLDNVSKLLDLIVDKEGVGSFYLTEPRFEYIDKLTSKPIKKLTPKNSETASKIFSLGKTLQAEPTQHLTELGKKALSLLNMINEVRRDNLDNGKGTLIEDLRKEMSEQEVDVEDIEVTVEE